MPELVFGPPSRGRGAPPQATGADKRRANLALLLFVVSSLAVSMSVGQEDEIETGSLLYWLLIGPAALLPFLQLGPLAGNLVGHARWLLVMLVLGGGWHLATGDARAGVQLGLLVWVTAWATSPVARISVAHIAVLYAATVGAGIAVDILTELNPWGLLPGRTADEYGIWRVSLFPNIANTGILSLLLLMLLTRSGRLARSHVLVLALVLYFLVFSFVRTAVIGAVVYLALRWWFGRPGYRPGVAGARMAWTAGLIAVGINLLIASSVIGLALAQEYPLLSRLLLRGESDLSAEEIFQQLYRPWLWGQHLMLFADSPLLMGHGAAEFQSLQTDELIEGHPGIGSDALPTRLLSAYGLAGLCFTIFMFSLLRRAAARDDRWACAVFPAVVLLMMNWGAVFHPTNAFFALFLLMVAQGSRGVIDGR